MRTITPEEQIYGLRPHPDYAAAVQALENINESAIIPGAVPGLSIPSEDARNGQIAVADVVLIVNASSYSNNVLQVGDQFYPLFCATAETIIIAGPIEDKDNLTEMLSVLSDINDEDVAEQFATSIAKSLNDEVTVLLREAAGNESTDCHDAAVQVVAILDATAETETAVITEVDEAAEPTATK